MRCEASISDADQFLVESTLARAFFIPSDEHDGMPLSVECEGKAPKPVEPKPKLFHVRKRRTVEGVDVRTPERRPELPQDTETRQELVLDGLRQRAEFRLEFRMEEHGPWHAEDNALDGIWLQVHNMGMDREIERGVAAPVSAS